MPGEGRLFELLELRTVLTEAQGSVSPWPDYTKTPRRAVD